MGSGREAEQMALGRLLRLGCDRLADVQVEDIGLGVVMGMVEGDRSDGDVHTLPDGGSFLVANAVITRAGF
jgi:hypothetical protein